jgi:Bacterial PH domain
VTAQWHRPYTPGSGRLAVIAWELGSLALLDWTAVRAFTLSSPGTWLLAGGLAALWLVGSWQVLRMGVYVGPAGIRVRGLLGTRTVRWPDVAGIVVERRTARLLGVELGMNVVIEHRARGTVSTPLWAEGIDFHRRRPAFYALARELRDRHARAMAG